MPLPTPNSGETQSAFISRCMSNQNVQDEFGKGSKQSQAVCFNQWREKESIQESTRPYLLEFSTPVFEFREQEKDFIIAGTAINETTTHNNHKYIAEELEKAAPGMMGKPLLVDHDNRVESIKGRVMKSYFEPITKSLQFEAKVMDEGIKEMIKDGRLTNVSIGAFAKELEKDSSGSMIAKGLDIVELSLVAIPADKEASFAMAMDKGYQIKEAYERLRQESQLTELLGQNELNEQFERRSNMEENKQLEVSELSELKDQLKVLQTERDTLREEKRQTLISRYRQLSKEKSVKDKDTTDLGERELNLLIEQLESFEVSKVEEKKELRSLVSVPKHEENFVIETDLNGRFKGLWQMPDESKLRRLHNDLSFGKIPAWQQIQ